MSSPVSRLFARLGAVLAAAVALIVSGGTVASAHVSVHADQAVQGGTAEIAFRVPTESDTAATVKLQVAFPTDTPIAKVSVLPHPGWTHQVTKTTLPAPIQAGHGEEVSEVVGQIEWAATGKDAAVKPGEYEVFRISAGPLPKSAQLVFKVVQTYDDNQVQRWIDLPTGGASEPEHPAPVLALAASSAEHPHGEVATMGHSTSTAATPEATPAAAWWALAIAGVALPAALGAVAIALVKGRRRGGEESPA